MTMKKVFLFSAIVVGYIGSMSCDRQQRLVDRESYNYYVWVNQSSHSVTLSLSGAYLDDADRPGYSKEGFEKIKFLPGAKHAEMGGTSESLDPPGIGWTMTVQFDDLSAVEFSGLWPDLYPAGYDPDFNPTLERNYASEEVEYPEGCEMCPGMRWTYTFTDEDYAAAVEYLAQVEAGEN